MPNKGKGREVNISLAIQRSATTVKAAKESSNSYDIECVPDDVWLFLFDYLSTRDLSALSKVSKKFYTLTQRPILRELTWAKATGASRNVEDWADGAALEPFRGVVRKVNVKLSYKRVNQNSALLLPIDWELYDAVHHRLLAFSNLRTLDLCRTIITPALYPVLEAIPSLRELSIVRCTFVWTYMYSPLLTNLGRQAPSPGLYVYNTNNRTLSPQHGHIRAPADPAQRAAQQAWLVDNTVFDFTTRLSHITTLKLQLSRLHQHSSETDDFPFPPSEISNPSILHPLYLLTIPSLTDLTLTWTLSLLQVYEVLRQPIQTNNQNPINMNAAPLPGPMYAANTLNVNLFTPLNVNLGQLARATIHIEDLSRDMMESISALFEQRVQHPNPGVAPLQVNLKVAKHALTEQNIATGRLRLPGVYRFEGPLPVAGLLMADSGGDLEEVAMSEAMETNALLVALEKLPLTLKKLSIKMYAWDREILYAIRMLFRDICELVINYGRECLEENTFVVLGSDILPDLKQLHTIKLIPSLDCVKREQQFRYPYHHGHPHHSHHGWWPGFGVGGNPHNQPPGPPSAPPSAPVPPPPPPPPPPIHPAHSYDAFEDIFDAEDPRAFFGEFDRDDDYLFDMPEEYNLRLAMRESIVTATAAANMSTQSPNAGPSNHASSSSSGSLMLIDQPDDSSSMSTIPGSSSGSGAGSSSMSSPGAGASSSSSPSASTSAVSSPTPGSVFGNQRHHAYFHRFGMGHRLNNANSHSPISHATSSLSNSNNGFHNSSPTFFNNMGRPWVSSAFSSPGLSSNAANPSVGLEPARSREEDADERRRIAQSLEDDLQDYLVGWNRHCPSLRVVQMERGWYWMRRFDGDVWTKMKDS